MRLQVVYSAMLKTAKRPVNIWRGPKLLPGDPEVREIFEEDQNLFPTFKSFWLGTKSPSVLLRESTLKKYPGSTWEELNELVRRYAKNYDEKAIKVPQGGKPKK